MKQGMLYKVFAGYFYMLDDKGCKTDYYKEYGLFKNTLGLVFFIHSASKGRCYAIYFAKDKNGRDYRTTFPVGKLIDEEEKISIKTRYNTFVWEYSSDINKEQIDSLYQLVKDNGDAYIPGLSRHPGVKEYFDVGHHSNSINKC